MLGKGKSVTGRRFYAELMPPVPTRPLPPTPPPPPLPADHLIHNHYVETGEVAERSPGIARRPENKLLRVFRRHGTSKRGTTSNHADAGRNSSESSHRRSPNTTESGSGWFGVGNSASSRSIGGWDDTSSDRGTISGATLVGSTATYNTSSYSTAYGHGACPAMEQPSRVASVDLEPQSLAEPWPGPHLACGGSGASQGEYDAGHGHYTQTRGCIPERSVSVGYTDREFGSNVGVLRFILRPHAVYAGILEVVDCEDMGVAYRKISRDGRLWCETFHEVPSQAAAIASSATAPAAFVGSVDSRWAGVQPTPIQSVSSTMTSTSTLLSRCGSPDHRHQQQQCWWQATEGHHKQRYPQTFELEQLWEMSSPCPTSFPLHCRDARGVIDPIPMTALVSDRYRFCYRFHLAGNKMKWMARSASAHMVELQCFVRTTLIALLQFGNNLAPDKRGQLQRRPLGKGKNALAADEVAGTEGRLPVVTIFPLAFSKLAPVDADIVESFVLFTGIEVLECLFYRTT
ncbi:hypothetical protein LPJ71_007596 [Coemansia sp. S17]|nr:hypothetical protein LPJ71_007596 [Coemansia sp. S17]